MLCCFSLAVCFPWLILLCKNAQNTLQSVQYLMQYWNNLRRQYTVQNGVSGHKWNKNMRPSLALFQPKLLHADLSTWGCFSLGGKRFYVVLCSCMAHTFCIRASSGAHPLLSFYKEYTTACSPPLTADLSYREITTTLLLQIPNVANTRI